MVLCRSNFAPPTLPCKSLDFLASFAMLVQFASILALAASCIALPTKRAASAGYLKVTSSGQVIGYVSRSLNSDGEFKGVSPDSDSSDVAHRMLVSLDPTVNGTQSLLIKVCKSLFTALKLLK